MKKNDYKTEFEEHRKEISLDEGHDVSKLPSRSELHRKGRKPKKKTSHTMINIILGLFTLIPVLILVYIISDFYTPEDRTSAKGEDTGTLFEVNTGESDGNNAIAVKDEEKKAASKVDEKGSGKPENETKAEGKPESKPVVNVNPPSEKKPEVKVETKPEKKPEVKVEPKPVAKTHTVGSNENLYRISLKYYGNGEGVTKIINANGLSSNEIRVGQTLVIP